jgi:chitinase
MSQSTAFLADLMAGKTIGPRDAIAKYSSWRLADIAYKLRKKGYNVRTLLFNTKDGQHLFAKYYIPSFSIERGGKRV